MISWGQDQITKLKELAAQGLSASQIALQIPGFSRSAVLGKLGRMGIGLARQHGHHSVTEPAESPTEPEPAAVPEPIVIAEPAAPCAPITTMEQRRGLCHFPVNDGAPWLHCGAIAPHGVYCEPHTKLTRGRAA